MARMVASGLASLTVSNPPTQFLVEGHLLILPPAAFERPARRHLKGYSAVYINDRSLS